MAVILLHYNKQKSKKGYPWTVHWKGKCFPARKVILEGVDAETVFKPDKPSNPRAWLKINGDGVFTWPRKEGTVTIWKLEH